jgi:hypothetical protein
MGTRAPLNVGTFTAGQQQFLEYHRDIVLLKARANIGTFGPRLRDTSAVRA